MIGSAACAVLRADLMYAHVVARARPGRYPLFDQERARWLWGRLQDAFPVVVGAILMPNHVHVVPPRAPGTRRRLACLLGAFSRRFDLGELWEPVPEPELIVSPDKLARDVRYCALNSCRPWKHRGRWVRLVGDPLEWQWSTLRDAVGAVAEPWCTAEQIADAIEWTGAAPARALHHYVSSDPSVAVHGTPFPRPSAASNAPAGSLPEIARAAIMASRGCETDLRRRGPARAMFVALARYRGFHDPRPVAQMCGVHPDTVPRLARACPESFLAAAALCLGDRRLTALPGPPRPIRDILDVTG